MITAFTEARFTSRNFPAGMDHWRCTRSGPRYHVSLSISATGILDCHHHIAKTRTTAWHCRLGADVPHDIVAAIAIALTAVGGGDLGPSTAATVGQHATDPVQ